MFEADDPGVPPKIIKGKSEVRRIGTGILYLVRFFDKSNSWYSVFFWRFCSIINPGFLGNGLRQANSSTCLKTRVRDPSDIIRWRY